MNIKQDIIFTHKKGQAKISLADIQRELEVEGNTVIKVLENQPFNSNSGFYKTEPLTYIPYRIADIPFNKDWECTVGLIEPRDYLFIKGMQLPSNILTQIEKVVKQYDGY